MDTISPEARSENMRRIRSKGMEPERIVRRLVFRNGYRYRLHDRRLPGRPDLVFSARRKVIFVHGCFWHQHEEPSCPIARKPKSNRKYWLPKLRGNVRRDQAHLSRLQEMGWRVLVIWECECRKEQTLAKRLRSFLGKPGQAKK